MKFKLPKLLKNLKLKKIIIFLLIFLLFSFFRFYELEKRHQFSWDQVDNAWVSKNMVVDHKFPLAGMPIKQNSGLFLGPFYYYLIAFFYWIFNLDPIASPVLAGLTALFTFFVLFFVTKSLFGEKIAFVSALIYSVSFSYSSYDRIQWTVGFIPAASLLIFYSLYKIIKGETKYLLLLAFLMGFLMHLHFTVVYFFLIVFFVSPFLKKKYNYKIIFSSILLFIAWILPILIYKMSQNSNNVSFFMNNNYHGFHLRRFFQLLPDAFIEVTSLLEIIKFKYVGFILFPLFLFLVLKKKIQNHILFSYLFILWFFVPVLVLSLYKGEISNYYFSTTRLFSVIIISYLAIEIYQIGRFAGKFLIVSIFLYYFVFNLNLFLNYNPNGLLYFKNKAYKEVQEGKVNEFLYGSPDSYLHYYYNRILHK